MITRVCRNNGNVIGQCFCVSAGCACWKPPGAFAMETFTNTHCYPSSVRTKFYWLVFMIFPFIINNEGNMTAGRMMGNLGWSYIFWIMTWNLPTEADRQRKACFSRQTEKIQISFFCWFDSCWLGLQGNAGWARQSEASFPHNGHTWWEKQQSISSVFSLKRKQYWSLMQHQS